MIQADDVFNPKDFESIRLSVHFQNFTTRTEVKDAKATLVEIGDKWLVFELPSKSCTKKHNVCADIGRIGNKKNPKTGKPMPETILKVTGKVFDVEELDDNRMRVTVECLQFDEQSWGELLNLFASRQQEIEKFFAAIKG